MNVCLPCCRLRLAGRNVPSRTCRCPEVNEDLRARVYARAAAAIRKDRAQADATWLASERDASVKCEKVTGLDASAPIREGE